MKLRNEVSLCVLCLVDDLAQTDRVTAEEVSRHKKTRSKKTTPALGPLSLCDDSMSVTGIGIH